MIDHLGDPCIHCGLPHDEVEAGPCEKATGLAATVRNIHYLRGVLAAHKERAEKESKRLAAIISAYQTDVARSEAGLDLGKIALAESFMYASDYSRGGEEKNSARQDAIKQFATGEAERYKNLRRQFFGTKNYDQWSGQRCDCEYGYGPRHGSICFSIGVKKEARERPWTDEEREAAVYYLINLERIQASKVPA